MAEENVWHASKIEEVFKMLETSERGLTSVEAQKRLLNYGANELEEEKKTIKLALLLRQLKSPLVGVLVAAVPLRDLPKPVLQVGSCSTWIRKKLSSIKGLAETRSARAFSVL